MRYAICIRTLILKSLINLSIQPLGYQQIRCSNWKNVRPILGWPRPHLARKGKKYPEAHTYNWLPYLPKDGSYTTKSLPIHKLGGRDMETGRVVVRTLGGGNPKRFRWVDGVRLPHPDGSIKEEEILLIRYDPLRTPKLALVADDKRKRWIMATEGMKVGDIIRTHSQIPRNPVRPTIGDAYPMAALAVGTKIHNVEIMPGEGAKFCLAAGTSAEIVARTTKSVVFKLSNGDQYKVEGTCMAVVGQMSNAGHEHVELWCPQRRRWLGKRPKSGLWHRKDGYCGRKIKPPKPLRDLTFEALKEKDFSTKSRSTSIYDLSY